MQYFQLANGCGQGFDNPADAPAGAIPITAEQFALLATTPVFTLSQVQAQQNAALYAGYLATIAQGVSYPSVGGVTKTYQSDPTSVSNLQSMLAAFASAGAVPAGFYWVAADNTQVPFTYADLQKLAAAMGAWGWAQFQQLQTLKAQVNAASTNAAASAITWVAAA